MAISKEILNNKKKKTNQPEPLGTVPANNPEHVSAPVDFHHPIPPKPVLHNSFAEAVGACEQIFLKPGEAHTEFYQENGIIHCVVGIGNYNPGYKHLYLTDTGSNMSIDERLDDMANQINILNNTVEVYVEDVNGLKKDVSILNRNIAEFENNINHALDDIRRNIEEFEESVNDLLENATAQIAELSEQVEDISNYVNGFDERIQQNTDNIVDLSARVGEIENWKPEVDASINRLEDLINGFEPITDTSIRSLFHDDIYTVNLCCYTAAGHVEIFDNVAGEKWGGDSSRVAECTPFNEYKTYVKGDDVSFMAVANEGYKFVNWFYGDGYNIIDYADTSIIELEFKESDIPVIGTLGIDANPDEPAILSFGYTAFFRKLHTLKWDLHTSSNTDLHSVEYNNDTIKVIITDIDSTPKEYIVDNNYTGKIYFDDGAKVEIISMSSEEGHHTFEGFTLNDSTERLLSPLIINNTKDDIKVDAYFKEWWVLIQTVPEPDDTAQIVVDEGSDTYHLHKTNLHINVIDIQEGYEFNKWKDKNISDEELELYIVDGELSSPNIVLCVDASVSASEFNLIGELQEERPTKVTATFIDYNGDELYTVEINKGEIPSYEGEIPIRADDYDPEINRGTEYTFSGWDLEIEAIYEDTTYTAIYNTRQYKLATKYIKEDINNISSEKDYLLLSAVTNDNFNITYSMDFNNSNTYLNSTKAYVEPFTTFEELEEFEIPLNFDLPLAYINIYENDGEKYLYVKDLRPEYEGNTAYNGYLAANMTANKFTTLYETISDVPENGKWSIDNTSINNNFTNKSIRYNSGSPRFLVYGSTSTIKDFAKLYYKETYKKYSNLLFGAYNQNTTPIVTNSEYIIATDD